MDYQAKLLETKTGFPFKEWRLMEANGLEQYTEENCRQAEDVLDTLIADLIALGENASEEDKLQKFQVAVEALNVLNDDTDVIETGEREELCDLFNVIAIAAGINPDKYGGEEGPASERRDW